MKPIFCLSFLLLSFSASAQSIGPKERQAREVATRWIHLMLDGTQPDSIMAVVAVPFQWDGKKIIKTKTELRETFLETIKEKGTGRPCTVAFEPMQRASPFKKQAHSMVLLAFTSVDGHDPEGVAILVCFKDGQAFVCGVRD